MTMVPAARNYRPTCSPTDPGTRKGPNSSPAIRVPARIDGLELFLSISDARGPVTAP
jgi:hypothetical protein